MARTAQPSTLRVDGIGFDPAKSEHHFLVTIPAKKDEHIYISEHFIWEENQWFTSTSTYEKPRLKKDRKRHRTELQRLVFCRFSYDEKLEYCERPENVPGPSEKAWHDVNAHLETEAVNLQQLVGQLSMRQFGHRVRVGDAFCGGGSVPFEAARIGCDSFGSDLSPVAALLTWAALNIIGGGPEVVKQVAEAQRQVYEAVDRQITEWGIEHDEEGLRADAYLYCVETKCPECNWMVPLAPSWVIGEKTGTVVKLVPDEAHKRFVIKINSDVPHNEVEAAKKSGTVKDSSPHCPNPACGKSTPIIMIRGDRRADDETSYGLRMWENSDIVPRPDDVFQERLYCIRWVETYIDDGEERTRRFFCAPTEQDVNRETKVLDLLRERFSEWQDKGFIPSRCIEAGDETTRLLRERGWTHWHHLFSPRQLLTNGLFFEKVSYPRKRYSSAWVGTLLGAARCCDYNSRLCRWHPHGANEKSEHVFSNQALNTLFNFGARSAFSLRSAFFCDLAEIPVLHGEAVPLDARRVSARCDIWLTDPRYADAINYHELSEFFLAWYGKHLSRLFPEWYTDSKRALAGNRVRRELPQEHGGLLPKSHLAYDGPRGSNRDVHPPRRQGVGRFGPYPVGIRPSRQRRMVHCYRDGHRDAGRQLCSRNSAPRAAQTDF